MKTHQGGGGAKHEEDSWESPSHHSSVHPQTSGTDCSQPFTPTESFIIPAVATRRKQSVGTYSVDFHCFIGHAIRSRWKYLKKERSREIRIWAMAASVKSETRFGNQFLLFFDARCRASRKPLYFIASSRLPQAEWEVWSKAVKTCPKPIEYFKVWLEDWLVQNFTLSKDFGFVNYQIHQAAVNMPHHPMKVTKTISIMELLLIERLVMPTSAINYTRHIHQPRRTDLPVQLEKGQGKESEQETVTVAVVNISNHRPRTTSEKLLQFETSTTSHLKAERNLEQIRRSRMPMKCVIAFESVLPSEKKSINFSC